MNPINRPPLLVLVLFAALALWTPASLPAQERDREGPEERRERAGRELRRDVEGNEAEPHEVIEPREHGEIAGREREGDPDRRFRMEMERLSGKLRELMEAGREEEAPQLKQQLARMEREFRAQQQRLGRERPPQMGPRPGEVEEAHRRLHHLRAAIGHLHEGGFHEPAEHLEREARRLEERIHASAIRPEERRESIRRDPPLAGVQAEVAELRAELRELRQAMQELRERR